jgi:hypothetical protein
MVAGDYYLSHQDGHTRPSLPSMEWSLETIIHHSEMVTPDHAHTLWDSHWKPSEETEYGHWRLLFIVLR